MKSKFMLPCLFILWCSAYLFGQDSSLQVLAKPSPNYTDIARQNVVIGIVKLNVLFQADGTIGEVTVVKALPFGLTESAIGAARRIRFVPKKVDGTPQTVLKPVEYRFDIYTDENDKDIKKKAKICREPVFSFTEAEKREINLQDMKLLISLGGDGVASLYSIEPDLDGPLRSKIEDAVSKIEFVPAMLKGGHRITTTRLLSLK